MLNTVEWKYKCQGIILYFWCKYSQLFLEIILLLPMDGLVERIGCQQHTKKAEKKNICILSHFSALSIHCKDISPKCVSAKFAIIDVTVHEAQ